MIIWFYLGYVLDRSCYGMVYTVYGCVVRILVNFFLIVGSNSGKGDNFSKESEF